jgi:hypothetical protein
MEHNNGRVLNHRLIIISNSERPSVHVHMKLDSLTSRKNRRVGSTETVHRNGSMHVKRKYAKLDLQTLQT